MSLTALIDGDLIAYINAASAEGDPEKIALLRADRQIGDILDYVQADQYQVYVSGGKNFRYEINPLYKANRVSADPIHRKATHNFLIREWKAIETDGYEADDALGCNQTDDTITCSLDKDLLMISGQHYSWPIVRKGVILRDHSIVKQTYEEGIRHFYCQMLIGDTADNIFGVAGIGKAKAPRILADCKTEKEMYDVVLNYYIGEDDPNGLARFNMNADCLWIWRHLGVNYSMRDI